MREDWPNSGKRKPDWRSRRRAAAKNGTHGSTGMPFTQNEASRPYTMSSRSAVPEPNRNDQGGSSPSQVVNTPRRIS